MRVLELINKLKKFDLDKKVIFWKLEKGGRVKIVIDEITENTYDEIIVNMDEE